MILSYWLSKFSQRLRHSSPRRSAASRRRSQALPHLTTAATERLEGRRLLTVTPELIDIVAGAAGSVPTELANVNGTLFFRADDGGSGIELWKSDGTAAGTMRVADINSGSGDSHPHTLTNVNGALFFAANDGTSGFELWRSDGTEAGTTRMADINAGSDGSNPGYLTNVNGTLFFSAFDGSAGSELWQSDGTEAGTTRVADINAGTAGSRPNYLTNVNGTLFFQANDGNSGDELWRSDGTEAGTTRVADINAGTASSRPYEMANVNGTLLFAADDGNSGRELWQSDGTDAGTRRVADINSGSTGSHPRDLTNVNGTLFFSVDDDRGFDRELWRSDGTEAGTTRVVDVRDGRGAEVDNLTNVNGTLFFSTSGDGGDELWQSDGTEAGTTRAADINSGSIGSSPGSLTNVNGTLFFRANDGSSGYELWKTDAIVNELPVVQPQVDQPNVAVTTFNTLPPELVRDINVGGDSSSPIDLTNVNGMLLFRASDGESGQELWRSDGTEAGTTRVADIRSGRLSSSPTHLTNVNGTLFFNANGGIYGKELWKSDGTEPGTTRLTDINPLGGSSYPDQLTNVNGTLFFRANDRTVGDELWKSDGTEAGTTRVADIRAGESGSKPDSLANVNGTLFFSANDGSTGYELWKSDGTEAGTSRVADIRSGSLGSVPSELTNVNGTLFFRANDGSTGYELWRSDGTEAGTTRVADIRSGSDSSNPTHPANVNGTLFFRANDGITGQELWRSDGTEAGTTRVADIRSGSDSSIPTHLANVNGTLFFRANDGVTGNELWQSDGTEAGTTRVADIRSGSDSSSPFSLTNVNGTLLFNANNGTNGSELWKLEAGSGNAIISNYVWDDADEDGVQDNGESGRDGVTVNLLNAAGDTQLQTTTTAGGGLYQFSVAPGTYIVEFVSPTGTRFSPRDQGGDDALDSDANVGTGRTGQITVIAGQIDDTSDAGLITDSEAPIVSINTVMTTDDRPGLDGEVNDATATVRVMVDGQTHTATNHGDGTWTLADDTLSALSAGVHNVVVTATDDAGNVGTDSTTNELQIANFLFDFGTAGSPVAGGYTQVLTSTLKSAGDFGWLNNTGLEDRDRTNVAGSLNRDYHKTTNTSVTFQAALTNGDYNVTINIGSGADTRDHVGVLLEGTQMATVSTARGQFISETHRVTVGDGLLDLELQRQGATATGINALTIVPATTEPQIEATDAVRYHRLGAPAAAVDPGLLLSDPNDSTLTGATVGIIGGFVAGEDVLDYQASNGITASYANGVLTLSGTATVAEYQAALRSVTFHTSGSTAGDRRIEFSATDATPGTGYDARTVSVLPESGASRHFDFNASGSPTETGFTPVTVDSLFSDVTGFGWLDDAVTNGLDARDRKAPNALQQDYHKVGSGTMTFAVNLPNGTYDVTVVIGSNVDRRDRVGVLLEGTQVDTVTTSRGQFSTETHRATVSDERLEVQLERQGNTGVSLNGLEIAEVTGAPRVELHEGPAVFEAGGAAIDVDAGLTLEDIDSTDLSGAIVRIIAGHSASTDTLSVTDQFGITSAFNSTNGQLTLSGSASVANYQTVLRSLQFDTTDTSGIRTIRVEVNDGAGTGSDTRDILVRAPFSGSVSYDFGTQTSDVESGFIGVNETTAYDPAVGYGWLNTANIESRNRSAPVPLDERRDYNLIRNGSMTFAVSLPNGRYDVTVTIGSSENTRDNVGVILEGTQVDSVSTGALQVVSCTHRVTVTDNRLEVELARQGATAAGINALMISDVT